MIELHHQMLRNLSQFISLSIILTVILLSACKRFENNEASPIKLINNEYHFHMKNHFFKIPISFMESYGIGKASGKVEGFTVHALLPNWEGHNSTNKAEFRPVGFGDVISILVEGDSRTLEEMETYWYEISYNVTLSFYSQRTKNTPIKISTNPDIIFLDGSYNETANNEYFYLENKKVKAMLSCGKPEPSSSPGCKLRMAYDDNIRLWITFSQKYQSDWVRIFKRIKTELHNFDQKIEQK